MLAMVEAVEEEERRGYVWRHWQRRKTGSALNRELPSTRHRFNKLLETFL